MSQIQDDKNELTQMNKVVDQLHQQIDTLAHSLEKARIAEYTEFMTKPWRLIWINMLAGTAKGVGLAIGFSVFAAIFLSILQWLNLLNLPIIGDYIADLVRVVQRQLEGKPY
ncbi:hypothetical protein BVG16_11440 [Paenibacillus selenitireducens]|uniref:Uncharacterized protein n=1 Tax=Paenibacillus selenitireducens TaxID=1324314 RepID=A0A1T2XF55_9BACL|nr:DUF5665 domain-containing protein [Paenibacillus selenitireducens]OPA78480.1 hypothetical protein BVG16_11440 [Paenibacillus selenitireducens]